jgi:threonine dehydratase
MDTIADCRRLAAIPAVLDDLLATADDAVPVHETSIITGMRMDADHADHAVEPSAAPGLAAMLVDRAVSPPDE